MDGLIKQIGEDSDPESPSEEIDINRKRNINRPAATAAAVLADVVRPKKCYECDICSYKTDKQYLFQKHNRAEHSKSSRLDRPKETTVSNDTDRKLRNRVRPAESVSIPHSSVPTKTDRKLRNRVRHTESTCIPYNFVPKKTDRKLSNRIKPIESTHMSRNFISIKTDRELRNNKYKRTKARESDDTIIKKSGKRPVGKAVEKKTLETIKSKSKVTKLMKTKKKKKVRENIEETLVYPLPFGGEEEEEEDNNSNYYRCTTCWEEFPSKDERSFHPCPNKSNEILEKYAIGFGGGTKLANLQCHLCSYTTCKKRHFIAHVARVHSSGVRYECHDCGRSFSNRRSIMTHVTREHLCIALEGHTCDLCGKVFTEKRYMREHRNIHTGETPYVCDVCGKAFKSYAAMNVHRRMELGIKPVKCDYCNATFINQSNMKIHVLEHHTRERNYTCNFCGKSFIHRKGLKEHVTVHSDERPFKCELCGHAFKLRKTLRQHYRVHRQKKEPTPDVLYESLTEPDPNPDPDPNIHTTAPADIALPQSIPSASLLPPTLPVSVDQELMTMETPITYQILDSSGCESATATMQIQIQDPYFVFGN